MNCSYCGKEIDSDSSYCKFCGRRITPTINGNCVYIVRSWIFEKESGLPEDKYISSEGYYLGYSRPEAERSFVMAHELSSKKAGLDMFGRSISVGAICRPNETNQTYDGCRNSIENTLLYWDIHTTDQNGHVFHIRKELTYSPLIPAIQLEPGKPIKAHYLFEFREYIVLDDSDDHHQGYVKVSEFYSSLDDALNRLLTEYALYSLQSGCKIGQIIDKRNIWMSELTGPDYQDYVYSFSVIKGGHRVKDFDIVVSYNNNQRSMYYV